jgi:hypothetical protein
MNKTSNSHCRLRLSALPSPTNSVIRRNVECELRAEGRDERLLIAGTVIGRPGGAVIVETLTQDDLSLGPVQAAKLLLALFEESGLARELEQHTNAVTEFEVTENDGGILGRTARDLRDSVWD